MVAARPALGFGWGNFGKDSVPYYRLAATYPLSSITVAHNMPLSNAAELGLLGAGLWLASSSDGRRRARLRTGAALGRAMAPGADRG